jgi:hypothetical protein
MRRLCKKRTGRPLEVKCAAQRQARADQPIARSGKIKQSSTKSVPMLGVR